MNRSMCLVVGDKVVFDGDVAFSRKNNPLFKYTVFIPEGGHTAVFTERGLLIATSPRITDGVKILVLWIWHMTILRKSHVYLTGVRRK